MCGPKNKRGVYSDMARLRMVGNRSSSIRRRSPLTKYKPKWVYALHYYDTECLCGPNVCMIWKQIFADHTYIWSGPGI